jgi:hypothetical protein
MIKNNKLILDYNDESIEKKFGEILRYVYNHFELDHDLMLDYYEDVNAPMDYDYVTDTKDLDMYINFWSNDKKDEKYIYFPQKKFDNRWYDDYPDLIKNINNFIDKKTTKFLKLDKVKKIVLINSRGKYRCINNDSRGVRQADWKLHTWHKYEITNNDGITFADLIIACYKIKSHKFENNYELYCGIEKISLVNGMLSITVNFDHGS